MSSSLLRETKQPHERWPDRFNFELPTYSACLWSVNPGGGRFFMPNREALSVERKLHLFKAAGIKFVEAHDTDILSLVRPEGYEGLTDESQRMGVLWEAVAKFKDLLRDLEMESGMFTMNLFNSDSRFNFGNFGSQYDEVRDLSIRRTVEGLKIASDLGSVNYVYWVGTNGTDGDLSAFHVDRLRRTQEALLEVLETALSELGTKKMVPLSVEAKPEEPKHKMYLGTVGDVLACIMYIKSIERNLGEWLGANIEPAHSMMAKLDAAIDYAQALMYGMLFHVHENGQGIGPGYDQDQAAGAGNMTGLVDRMYQLVRGGYKGLIGMDVQPLPGDGNNQQIATVERSMRAITWAIAKAQLLDNDDFRALQAAHDQAGIEEYLLTKLYYA